jgi:hypothetical protein
VTDYEDPWGRPPADEPPAPGWWKASDGNWYPPTSQPATSWGGPAGFGATRPTASSATGALVCAILSWVVCPVILAVVALVLASQAQRKIRDSGGQLDGEGQIKAAKWIAWLNIGLFGLFALFFAVIAVIAIAFGDSGSNSEFGLRLLLDQS